jgi:hypothetical protein
MENRLNVSMDRLDTLTVDEMVAVENVGVGSVNIKALRGIVAKFLVDGNGVYLDESAALKEVGKLLRPQFLQVAREFFTGVSNLAVNPTTDGS